MKNYKWQRTLNQWMETVSSSNVGTESDEQNNHQ